MPDRSDSNVIEIGDFRIGRKRRSPRGSSDACAHRHMTIDDHGDVITCDDCGKQLGAMWVLRHMLDDYTRQFEKLRERTLELNNFASENIHLIAARRVEVAWRKRDTVPACPHCLRGILASDHLGSVQINKRLEMLRRERDKRSS